MQNYQQNLHWKATSSILTVPSLFNLSRPWINRFSYRSADIAEVDISKFHLDQDEMNARKAFVSNYKRKLSEIKADLAAPFDRVRLPFARTHPSSTLSMT